MRLPFLPVLGLSVALPLAACGGGGGGDDKDRSKPVTVPALALGLGAIHATGYVAVPPERQYVGENDATGNAARGFFTFTLDAFRSGDVEACRLHALPALEYGNPEASPIDGFVAEPVAIGAGLDALDYARPADLPPSARAARVMIGAGAYAYEFDVLAHVRAALAAGQSTITFRIRILGVADLDGQPDGLLFNAGDPAFTSQHPTLEATVR